MALAFVVLIVFFVIAHSLWIMAHLDHNADKREAIADREEAVSLEPMYRNRH
jgi:cell division protein FtsI/penicillin-binding protein 2